VRVSKIAALLHALVLSIGQWGMQMCCNVGGVSFILFAGGERKNKINLHNNIHCLIKKLNPFLFQFCQYSICLVACLFTLVANGWQ